MSYLNNLAEKLKAARADIAQASTDVKNQLLLKIASGL